MASFVLCSELNQGARVFNDLAACALELDAQGHQVSLICSDLNLANTVPEFDEIEIFQAPSFDGENQDARRRRIRPRNLSELFLAQGYDSQAVLVPVLRAWLSILRRLDADYILCDQAPTALLASKILSIDSVMIGDGFNVPPKTETLPNLRPWRSEVDKVSKDLAQVQIDDQSLLDAVNESLKVMGINEIEMHSVQDLYSHADQWVMSVPEMDHYGSRRLPYVVRWPSTKSCEDAKWPDVDGDKVLVVLDSSSSHCKAVLSQLSKLELPVLAVILDASPRFIERFNSQTMKVQTEMVNIRSVAQQCKIIFCHSKHDLVYELLMFGVPSILLPKGIENTLLTYRLAKKRLGFAGPSKSSKLDARRLIEITKNVDQVWHNASRFSLKYATHTSLTRLQNLLEELCLPES